MTPEQKQKILKLFWGALAAGGIAFATYLTGHWHDVFGMAGAGYSGFVIATLYTFS